MSSDNDIFFSNDDYSVYASFIYGFCKIFIDKSYELS